MTKVSRSFEVRVPPSVAIPYLADFSNAVEWDPGTQTCIRNDAGPVKVGSSWHNTSKLAGISTELTYTLEEMSDERVVLVGRNDTATSTETIDVVPSGAGSQVTYTNDLEFNGAAKLAAPAAKLLFERVGNDVEQQLTEALNALAA